VGERGSMVDFDLLASMDGKAGVNEREGCESCYTVE